MPLSRLREKGWRPVQSPPPMPGARRVLVISHMFPHPDQPGSGSFILEQVQALRRAGVDARVVSCRPVSVVLSALQPKRTYWSWRAYRQLHEECGDWWMLDGVPVRYLPYPIYGEFETHGRGYRAALRLAMRKLERDFAPEVVHAHTAYLDGSAARMLARAWRVPYAITEHTGPFSLLTTHPVVRATTLRAIADADRLVCVSRALQKTVLAEVGDPKVQSTVIPNVVDTNRFFVGAAPAGRPDAPRLLFVGYFVPVKNIPLLLDAFALVLAHRPRATLQLVGGGETEAQTRALVADIAARGLHGSVRVRTFVPRDEVARLMREECDMLVLPSRSETFGCVVAEALASGRPAVATRCGGPEDIVTEAWMGALCANGDPAALARAIVDVADRLPAMQPQRLGASARERFGGPAVARRIAALYEDMLQARAKDAPHAMRTDTVSR